MNLLDTFAFLFTTNAKQAQKDVEGFGKSTQNVQDTLNRADASSQKLGLSFSKLALAGGAALAGFASLGKLKQGITDTINYNAEIEKTAKLTGINARELALWNSVVSRAGGNPGGKEYLSFITKLNSQYAGLGINDRVKRVNQDLVNISQRFAELEARSPGSSQAYAAKLGIGPDLWLALKDGPKVFQANIEAQKLFNNTTEQTGEAALKLKGKWSLVSDEFQSFFTEMIPLADAFATGLLYVGAALRIVAITAAAAYHSVKALFALGLFNFKDAKKEYGRAGSDLVEAGKLFWQTGEYLGKTGPYADNATAATPGTGGGVAGSLPGSGPRGIRNNNPGNLQPGGVEATYGSLQEGIAAEKAQISRYGARGVNTLAGIASIWPDRAHAASWLAAVSKTSGFGPNQKLNLSDPSTISRIAQGINVAEGDGAANSIIAGQGILAQANSASLPGGRSGSKSVTIGSITINTQATDAKGIATDLHSELASTVGAFDDGVAK